MRLGIRCRDGSMNPFKENDCRLCREVLCCVKCRRDHENQVHHVNPDCDICLYGRVRWKRLPADAPGLAGLLGHLEAQHWPLACRRCKRRFESVGQLGAPGKCPAGSASKRPALPALPAEATARYDSPPLSDFHKNLPDPNVAASTPTPKLEPVTPGDDADARRQLPAAGSTPGDSRKHERSLKRRVTFCETPVLEYPARKLLLNVHKSASIAEEDAPGKLRPKLRIVAVHQTMIDNQSRLPDKALEISVSPLINNDTANCDSSETGVDSHKSIIAGSNQYFFGKQKNTEAVTSTPRVGKQDDQRMGNADHDEENKLPKNYANTPDNVTSKTANMQIDSLNNKNQEEINKCTPASYQTPIMSTSMKQKQLLATTKQCETTEFYSMTNLKQATSVDVTNVSPQITENKDKELVHNNYIKSNIQIEETLWMSAVNNLNCSGEEDDTQETDASVTGAHGKILSVCLKKVVQVPQNMIAISTETHSDVTTKIKIPKSNLWTSMTQAFNSVVSSLSLLNKSGFVGEQMPSSTKRSWADDEADDDSEPHTKRLKMADIKCRRTIRPICPLSHSVFKIMVDKATQTD